jgi:hypothetical protein
MRDLGPKIDRSVVDARLRSNWFRRNHCSRVHAHTGLVDARERSLEVCGKVENIMLSVAQVLGFGIPILIGIQPCMECETLDW